MAPITKYRQYLQVGIFLCVFISLSLAFNNCGQSPQDSAAYWANLSEEEKLEGLLKLHGGSLSSDFCRDSTRYECIHKVFAEGIEQAAWPPVSECLVTAVGDSLCPLVSSRTYNTAAASRACGEQCWESYNYEEYQCHLKLAGGVGHFPLVKVAATLTPAIEELQTDCFRIVQGSR